MGQMMAWFREQWVYKKFRVLTAVMVALSLILGMEFYLFQYGFLKIIRYYILVWALAAIAWIDQGSKRIPNKALLVLLIIRTMILVLECLLYHGYWMSILMSAGAGLLFAGGMFLLCFLISRGGMGAGDVKLSAMLGYYMGGGAVFTAIFLTVLSAAVYSAIALLMKKATLKQEIPFAPFVLAGALMTIMLGV